MVQLLRRKFDQNVLMTRQSVRNARSNENIFTERTILLKHLKI